MVPFFYNIVSLIKVFTITLPTIAQLVSMFTYTAGNLCSTPVFF
jgi:hypothetical protein